MTHKNFKPVKITDHFYQLGTPFFPMYLSIGDEAMLIEGGTGGTTDIVIGQIKEIGINPEKIKYIALTHSHSDHIGSITQLRIKWPHLKLMAGLTAAKTLSNERVVADLVKLDDFIIKRMKVLDEIQVAPPLLKEHNFNVDIMLEENSEIDLGSGIKWSVFSTPGHSPCQIAFLEKKESTLAIGDSTGLYYPETDSFWPNYFISLEQYCNSIRKLAGLNARRLALSHYAVIENGSKTFFQKALKATEDYHLEMLERVYNGEDPNEIALEKAQWIESFVVHMPFRIMEQLSKLLINRSQKDADKEGIFTL
jgi:2-aminobenzoylacetyl-CoA thioesterase